MNIISNGSKWLGQAPDGINELLETLDRCVLDPSFEDCGGFVHHHKDGSYRVMGNFHDVSHVFNITGTYAELETIISRIYCATDKEEYILLKQKMDIQI